MARSKRKFNWDELSSEEEEVEVKKVAKKGDSKMDTKKIDKEDEKKVEDQADKFSKLSVKSTELPSTRTSTRSARGSVKRELDFEAETDTASLKKARTSRSTAASVKEESSTTRSGRTVREKPIDETIKEEKVSPKKATKKGGRASQNESSNPVENGHDLPVNMLVKKENAVGSQEENQADCKELQLPVINIKSIKMKVLKPRSCGKKMFNKHLHNSPSPTKSKPLKFTEIKIDLSEEQRDWFKKQLEKYDGVYDEEFDLE